MDMEYSITPPMSPSNEEENEVDAERDDPQHLGRSSRHDLVQCLACNDCFRISLGDHRSPTAPPLNRILAGKDPCPASYQGNTCELFGHTYVTGVALLDKAQHLFCLARQCIDRIQTLLGQGSNWALIGPIVSEAKRHHGRLMSFLQYVQVFVHRYFSLPDMDHTPSMFTQQLAGFPALLLSELQSVALYNGRISDLPPSVLQSYAASSITQESTGNLLLHIILSTQWSILQVQHILQAKLRGLQGEQDAVSSFNERGQELMQDLLSLASARFDKMRCSEHAQQGPFLDGCLQGLWSSLIQLLDSRHHQYATDSFWCTFHSILMPSLDNAGSLSQSLSNQGWGLSASDPVGLTWWLLHYLAPLYQWAQTTQHQGSKQTKPIRSYWLLAEDLLKLMFSNGSQLDEAHTQCYLKSCLALCHLWEPRGAILTLLWAHFHKRLNNKMLIPGQGIQNLATVRKNAHSWYDQCKERVGDHTASRNRENGFDLFLRILATQLAKMKEDAGAQGWKQLQGRFYSKFHGRSMKELDETGLSRFLSLFLVVSLVTDMSAATSRMLDFLDLLPTDTLTHGKLMLIWRGLFTLCLIHEGQECDLTVIAERLVQGFNTVCLELTKKDSLDSNRKSQLWALILSYIEGTQDVFDASNKLEFSEEKLIGSGLGSLLDVSSEHEMRTLLVFIQTIMARHRILYQQMLMQRSTGATTSDMTLTPNLLVCKYKALARNLWQHVYPFIKKHASTQTPPPELADVATSFTLLSADLKLSQDEMLPRQPTAQEMFQYFGLEDHKVHYSITVRYLGHLLPNQCFSEHLHVAMGHTQWASSLVHAWIRCGLQVNQASTPMQELTRLVFKLGEVSTLMANQGNVIGNGASHQHILLKFMQALGHQFNSAKGLQERVQSRQRCLSYFGDLVGLIQPMLRTMRAGGDLPWIYKVVGQAVKYCSSILYVKGKSQAQLPGILTELVLPPALFNPKKSLPQPMLQAIRDTLHLFLEGLAKLDLQRDEFIQRKVQEIVQQYFLKFHAKTSILSSGSSSSSTANHPIMVALHKSCSRSPPQHISTLREAVLKLLQKQFLAYHGQQPPGHVPYTLAFLQELMQRTSFPQQVVRDAVVLLPTVLDYLLLCDVTSIKKSTSVLLTTLLDSCKKDTPPDLESQLLAALGGFMARNLRVHQVATLRSLETVAAQHPALVAALIEDCSRLVAECEYKRGVGADATLRHAYCQVLSHLGDRGQAVIARIKKGEKLHQP